jgi:hypothetical protein
VLNVKRGAIVVADSAAIGEPTLPMMAKAAANFSTVAAITTGGRVIRKSDSIDDHAAASTKAIVSHDCAASGRTTIAGFVSTQMSIAESIPTGPTMSCCKMKRRFGDRYVAKTVNAAAVSFTSWFDAVTTDTGITTDRDGVFKGRVVDSYVTAGDIDSAALGQSTKSTISVSIRIDTATVAADGGAVFEARAVDVKRPVLEINRSTFGWRAGAVVKVAGIVAVR